MKNSFKNSKPLSNEELDHFTNLVQYIYTEMSPRMPVA